jgi:hypothetical protein
MEEIFDKFLIITSNVYPLPKTLMHFGSPVYYCPRAKNGKRQKPCKLDVCKAFTLTPHPSALRLPPFACADAPLCQR